MRKLADGTDRVNSVFTSVFLLPSAPGECNSASLSHLTDAKARSYLLASLLS